MSQYVRDSTPDSSPSECGDPRLHHVTSFPCKLQVEKNASTQGRRCCASECLVFILFGKGLNRLS